MEKQALVSNSIELFNRNMKQIAVLRLYRVMWIGRLDTPDDDVEYQAILRECVPSGICEPGGREKVPDETTVIVPKKFTDVVFNAFSNDLYVLAQFREAYLRSIIMLPAPDFFDVVEYLKERKHS